MVCTCSVAKRPLCVAKASPGIRVLRKCGGFLAGIMIKAPMVNILIGNLSKSGITITYLRNDKA
jgi:hypothetical protein